MKTYLSIIALVLGTLFIGAVCANTRWQFAMTAESQRLINGPFGLIGAADLDGNGKPEIVTTNFGRYGDKIGEWVRGRGPDYALFVLEWANDALEQRFHKRWNLSDIRGDWERQRYFSAWRAKRLVTWPFKDREVIESIPPYLGLGWDDGYVLHEQQGAVNKPNVVGSWALPWVSPFCYQGFRWGKTQPPHECIVGIRDFSGSGQPKMVTIFEKEIIKDKKYDQTLRVRSFEKGFPIEWEMHIPDNWLSFILRNGRYRWQAANGVLLQDILTRDWYRLELDNKSNYRLRLIEASDRVSLHALYTFDLPDNDLGATRIKDSEEYWGYRRVDIPDPQYINFRLLLRRATLNRKDPAFVLDDIDFPHHDNFLGVGYFLVADVDGDDLDEVILVEETGKTKPGHDRFQIYDVKDYIRILKWDGKQYRTMWVSPPYTKRGTKFLIADLRGTGKNQLVVLSPYGTIQIWEQK